MRNLVSSGSPYEPKVGISRAVRARPIVTVAGTAPLGPDGRTVGRGVDDWQAVAAVHGEFFRDIRPANTIMQVSRFIDADWLIEIEADAVVDEGEKR